MENEDVRNRDSCKAAPTSETVLGAVGEYAVTTAIWAGMEVKLFERSRPHLCNTHTYMVPRGRKLSSEPESKPEYGCIMTTLPAKTERRNFRISEAPLLS